MKIIKLGIKYLMKYKLYLFQYLFIMLIFWASSMALPLLSGRYIDVLVDLKNKSSIYFYTTLILIVGLIICITSYLKSVLNEKLSNKSTNYFNLSLVEHIKLLPMSYFKDADSVYLIEKIRTDTHSIIDFNLSVVMDISLNLVSFLLSFAIMFSLNVKVSLLLLVVIPIYLLIYLSFKHRLYFFKREYLEKYNSYISSMNKQLNNVFYIKLNSLFSFMHNQIKNLYKPFFICSMKLTKVSSVYTNITQLIDSIANVILFLYGGLEVFRGNITVGEFTILNLYFNAAFDSLQSFLLFGSTYQQTLVSYNRIDDLLSTPPEKKGDIILDNINTIEFNNLSFRYDKGKDVIRELNYCFKKGNIYCIKGCNGSGKSTLLKLLLGIEHNYEGDILFNNIPLKNIDHYKMRSDLVGVAEQEPFLLNDTIRNNLVLEKRETISDSELLHLINILDLNSFITNLPMGLQTTIEDTNLNLSGGQKQKLSLIKALVKKADLLVLDEPTSALDQNSIHNFLNLISSCKADSITIIVTHEDTVSDFADMTLVLSPISDNAFETTHKS